MTSWVFRTFTQSHGSHNARSGAGDGGGSFLRMSISQKPPARRRFFLSKCPMSSVKAALLSSPFMRPCTDSPQRGLMYRTVGLKMFR